MIEIEIEPAGIGRHSAFIGKRLVTTSRTPFLSTARTLVKEGSRADTPIRMRHRGSSTISLQSTVGHAARLKVKETIYLGPVFVRYEANALNSDLVEPFDDVETTGLPFKELNAFEVGTGSRHEAVGRRPGSGRIRGTTGLLLRT